MRHEKSNPRRRKERALGQAFGELHDRLQENQQRINRHSSRTRQHRIEVLKRKLSGTHRLLGRLHEKLAHYGKWSTSTKAKESVEVLHAEEG